MTPPPRRQRARLVVSGKRQPKAASKRRDQDPVRVYADGRVAYWTGGATGAGQRRFERCGSHEAARVRAEELRADLLAARNPRDHRTLDELAQFMLDEMRETGSPEGTVRQYRSNWNTWVPEQVGATRCRDAGIAEVSAILKVLGTKKSTLGTVNSVIRTLNSVIRAGHLNGWLESSALGGESLRREAYRTARRRAADAKRGSETITLDMCPSVTEVDAFAASMNESYPGYGERLVYAALSSGMRLCEVLALTVDDVDLDTGEVAVLRQLDRYGNWPDTAPPKGGKERVTVFWSAYQHVWESLVADAIEDDRTHLFPRHRSVTKFADRVGVFCREAREAAGTEWGFHWLRHAYATWSLAYKEDGGYGLDLASVSEWLGHHRTSVTQDLYVSPAHDHRARAREVTRRVPTFGKSPTQS